mmetsp:Transcript_3712/g.16296  ORF Transcript_3712/g.16296 Transcript_3712/m.16296 type:complete len:97 (-) Transcript_3712:2033-2323(-)
MVSVKVLILFLSFIIYIGMSALVDARSTAKTSPIARSLKSKQRRCEKSSACHGLHDEHLQNCILKCASEYCYELIYAKDPVSGSCHNGAESQGALV